MTAIRNLLRALFRHDAMNREMNDEMQAHMARATERLVSRGMSRRDAEAAARREFGNVAVLAEDGRDARGASWVDSLRGDIRHGIRTMVSSPAFTTVAVLSLAIGIGANTAIFSLINAVMLRSLPVARPEQLVTITVRDSLPKDPDSRGLDVLTNPLWESIRDATVAEADYAVSGPTRFNLADGGEARNASAMWVNGAYFNTLGVRPAEGRLISAADDFRGCPGTVVASEAFWRSELGGARDAIGKPLVLSGKPYTLLGIVPREFFGVDVGSTTQLYVPLCAEPIQQGEGSALAHTSRWWLRVIARPKPGVSVERLGARLRQASPAIFSANTPTRYNAAARAEFVTRKLAVLPAVNGLSDLRLEYSKALLVLMGMVAVILLISCANVANLMLARAASRSREMAIRVAIGASRWRLLRQSLTEALLLALAGTLLGGAFAVWASRILVSMMGSGTNQVVLDLSLDLRVLGFAAVVCLGTVLLFGLVPAWRSSTVDPHTAMKSAGRGTIEGHNRFAFGKALVVVQSAMALILVVGAALLTTTFRQLTTQPLGFDPRGVVVARLGFGRSSMPQEQRGAYLAQLRTQLAAMPGVQSVSAADITPVSGAAWNDVVVVEDGYNYTKPEEKISWFNMVSPGYFATMRTRLIAGRDFGPQDTPTSAPVAIVNEAMARHFFKDQSPIGKVYYTDDMGRRGKRVTIIGVVENSRYQTMREDAQRITYLTHAQDPAGNAGANQIVVRAASVPAALTAVKSTVGAADPRISLTLTPMADLISQSVKRERLLAVLAGFFGSLALLLAMIGLYGVMAYTVARRRIEIGIRIALGAARGRVVRLVLGDVGMLVGTGIVIGGAVTFVTVKVLGSLLYGVEARDPRAMAVAALVLAAAALLAGAIPARRAAALQPVEALRED